MRCLRWVIPCAALILALASAPRAGTVTVYAAASLTGALQELTQKAKEQHGVEVRPSFGSSSSLARQIERGAPADIYLSANREWMDYLESLDLIEKDTRADLLGNALVIVALRGEGFRVEPRKGFDFAGALKGRLAVGDPAHVPAGTYARQALQRLGWWDKLAGRLVPALDVRAALAYVERGECAAGVVYATDAVVSPKVEVIATLPAESHDRIVCPMAAVKGRNTEEVRRLTAFLRSDDARKVFERHGFTVLKSGGQP